MFIEIMMWDYENALVNINHIENIHNNNGNEMIFLQSDERILVRESYEEVKQLIEQAQAKQQVVYSR